MLHTPEEIKQRIEGYTAMVDEKILAYYTRNKFTFEAAPKSRVEYGRKFAKVLQGSGVHTFIDLSNGDILKAATYKAPAPNGVRGNIFAADFGASVVNEHGANYLK